MDPLAPVVGFGVPTNTFFDPVQRLDIVPLQLVGGAQVGRNRVFIRLLHFCLLQQFDRTVQVPNVEMGHSEVGKQLMGRRLGQPRRKALDLFPVACKVNGNGWWNDTVHFYPCGPGHGCPILVDAGSSGRRRENDSKSQENS